MPVDLLKEKNLIEDFLRQAGYQLSSFSFISLFSWKDFFDFDLQAIDGNLCIFAQNVTGCFLYLPPLGKRISEKAVTECFRIMNAANKNSGVSRIENVEEGQLKFFPQTQYTAFRKSDEYVYAREEIARLQGNKFKSQRCARNYFTKHYAHDFLPYSSDMSEECVSLYAQWAEQRNRGCRDGVYRQMLEENRSVHRLLLREYEQLGLVGRVIRIDDKIKAYTFGFCLDKESFCVLLEIADLQVKGIAPYVFSRFCADEALKNYPFINAMDDFGMENIKKTKLSFHPCRIIPSYVVSRKREER